MCFNNWILLYKEKPYLTMLKEIRCMFMILFTERREKTHSWTNIPPRVKKELDDAPEARSKMNAITVGDFDVQL